MGENPGIKTNKIPRNMFDSRTFAAAALLAVAFPAAAASVVVPAAPVALEPVDLRMTVDSCSFVPATVRVLTDGGKIHVMTDPVDCSPPGPARTYDVRLGSFPQGEYRVEVHHGQELSRPVTDSLSFAVVGRAEAAVFPPPPRPLTDYSGFWWSPEEGGWGIALAQSPKSDAVFGAWFVYNANGQPEWYTVQGGGWESATRWSAPIYRSTGPALAGPGYDPRLVLTQPAGQAAFEFGDLPNGLRARFTYTLTGAAAVTKSMARFTP